MGKKVYGEGFWIGNMQTFANILFLVIILSGVAIGYSVSNAGSDPVYFVIPIVISILIGILTVGFVKVFLNMASDIRTIRAYLIENGEKWIPGQTYSQQ